MFKQFKKFKNEGLNPWTIELLNLIAYSER
jgi:hypothetical protein